MKEFLFLFRGGDSAIADQSPEQTQVHMQKWMKWMGSLGEQGRLVGAQPLDTSGKQVQGTKMMVTDGPFMEGKEMVGGYLICKAESYDEAVHIAKDCPVLEFEDGNVEIREINVLAMS